MASQLDDLNPFSSSYSSDGEISTNSSDAKLTTSSSNATLSTTPSNAEPPTSSASNSESSMSSSDLLRAPVAEYATFKEMVEAAVTALERNLISTQSEYSLVLKLRRTHFSALQLEGMCWSESEGDVYVEFTCTSPSEDRVPCRPLVEISHADTKTSSRVLGQLKRFLKDLRESPMISCPQDPPQHILQVYIQLKQHLQALPQHCLNCNFPHTLHENHPIWRPTACRQPLCAFAASEMQNGNTLSKISMAPAVADLEVSLYAAAIKRTESRPSVLSDTNFDYIFVNISPDEQGRRRPGSSTPDNPRIDWRKILSTLNALPPLHELPTGSQALEMHLDGKTPGLFRLLQCALTSAPGFLVQVRDGELLKDAGIPHIFLYHPNDDAQLRSFRDLECAAGCLRRAFAFHGSANHKWRGILRDGLMWASALGLHSCVAPDGEGISLARYFRDSFPYCHGEGAMWPESTLPDDPGLMALCEILYEPSEAQCGGLYVVKDPERVVVRALLVFSRSDRNSSNVATAEEESLCMNADKLASRLTALPIYQELHAWEPQ
eukprot:jgi/Botrbrau1/7778/Bobra.0159s0206.1